MYISIIRYVFTEKSTIGSLLINGQYFCDTLEDKVRAEKIYGSTAIPQGTYKVELHKSNKFNRLMPYILDVPNYTGVMIHWGNRPEDTEGCILVGKNDKQNWISNSKDTFNKLFIVLQEAVKHKEEIWLTIK